LLIFPSRRYTTIAAKKLQAVCGTAERHPKILAGKITGCATLDKFFALARHKNTHFFKIDTLYKKLMEIFG